MISYGRKQNNITKKNLNVLKEMKSFKIGIKQGKIEYLIAPK